MPHGDGVDRLREVAADAHHGLRQQKAKGDADALSYVLQQARDANAPAEDISQITSGFTKIASELLGEQGQTRRRSWHPFNWLRRADPPGTNDGERLPAPDQQRQLPPGG